MEQWQKDLQKNLLQKAVNTEFGYNVPVEDMIIKKAKAYPEGTVQMWGNSPYVKTGGKWVLQRKLQEQKGVEGEKKELSSIVITDPDKFKVVSEVVNDKFNRPRGKKFKINGIVVCEIESYKEYFSSIKRGTPSNIRDTVKMAHKTRWDREGLRKVTGIENISVGSYRRGGDFTNIYPDTTWGDTGGLESATGIKEKISSFIKQNRPKVEEKKETPTEKPKVPEKKLTFAGFVQINSVRDQEIVVKDKEGKYHRRYLDKKDNDKLRSSAGIPQEEKNAMVKKYFGEKKEEKEDESKGKFMQGRSKNPELRNINTGKEI